jgi:hypothetical protein
MSTALSFINSIAGCVKLESIEGYSIRFMWSAAILVGFSFIGWALRLMLLKLKDRLSKSQNADMYFGRRSLLKAMANPIMLFCLVTGALLALDVILPASSQLKEYIPLGYKISGVVFLSWVCEKICQI